MLRRRRGVLLPEGQGRCLDCMQEHKKKRRIITEKQYPIAMRAVRGGGRA